MIYDGSNTEAQDVQPSVPFKSYGLDEKIRKQDAAAALAQLPENLRPYVPVIQSLLDQAAREVNWHISNIAEWRKDMKDPNWEGDTVTTFRSMLGDNMPFREGEQDSNKPSREEFFQILKWWLKNYPHSHRAS